MYQEGLIGLPFVKFFKSGEDFTLPIAGQMGQGLCTSWGDALPRFPADHECHHGLADGTHGMPGIRMDHFISGSSFGYKGQGDGWSLLARTKTDRHFISSRKDSHGRRPGMRVKEGSLGWAGMDAMQGYSQLRLLHKHPFYPRRVIIDVDGLPPLRVVQ